MAEKTRKEKPTRNVAHIVFTILGILLCIIFIPILVLNTILIVKGALDDSKPPNAFGIAPLVVLSGSMDDGSPDAILVGDLILVKECDAKNLKVNDVIAFMEGDYAVTHRIIAVNDDGTYTTQGDANNVQDSTPVTPEHVIGKYFYRFPGVGDAVIFIQSTKGMLVCVGIPLLLFVIYDIIRRQILLKKEKIKQDQLKQELEELKQNPNQVDLPREVLKKPQEEAQVEQPQVPVVPEVKPQFEPAPERMAETITFEQKPIIIQDNYNNAEAPKRCNEPSEPQTAKVKVGAPKKATVQKGTAVKVKVPKKK